MPPSLFCVITVVKQGGATLSDCLASVTSLKYRPLMHLVVESGLAPEATRLFDEHRLTCEKVGIAFQMSSLEPKGVYPAMNHAVTLVPQGSFVHFLNADDKFVNFDWVGDLEVFEDPEVNFFYGAIQFFSASGALVIKPPRPLTRYSWVSHQALFVREHLLKTASFEARFGLAADSVWASRTLSNLKGVYSKKVIAQVGLDGLSYRHPWRLTLGFCRHLIQEGRYVPLIAELAKTSRGMLVRAVRRLGHRAKR